MSELDNYTHNHPPPPPGNWIAVSRDMRDHPVVGFGKRCRPAKGETFGYSRAEAWQDLVMEAQFRRSRTEVNNSTIWLEVGQLLGGRDFLAKRWNWTDKAVRSFLDRLESEGMIYRGQPEAANPEGPAKGQPLGEIAATSGQNYGHLKGQPKSAGQKSLPNVITVCNYSRYQHLADAISDYVADAKRATDQASYGPATGQLRASGGSEKGPESNNKHLNTKKDDSRARSKIDPGKDRDPFNLNPGAETGGVVRDESGRLVLANGRRAFWLKQFNGNIEELDLALIQAAGWIQPNSTMTIERQVEAQLAKIAREDRQRSRNYQDAATKNAVRKTSAGTAAPKIPGVSGLSLEERLEAAREAKRKMEANR